jgi:hypothetical protein
MKIKKLEYSSHIHQRRIAARGTSLLSDPKAQQEYKIFSRSLLLLVLKRKVPST